VRLVTVSDVVRVLLGGCEPIVREGLRTVLHRRHGFVVVGECDDPTKVVDQAFELQPHVAIVDYAFLRAGDEKVITALRMDAGVPVLVFGSGDDDHQIAAAFRAGATGYAPPHLPSADLHRAVHEVAAGNAWVHSSGMRALLDLVRGRLVDQRAQAVIANLTPREREVFQLLARGYTNREIASELDVRDQSAKTYATRVMRKLGLRNRAAVAVFAFDNSLVSAVPA